METPSRPTQPRCEPRADSKASPGALRPRLCPVLPRPSRLTLSFLRGYTLSSAFTKGKCAHGTACARPTGLAAPDLKKALYAWGAGWPSPAAYKYHRTPAVGTSQKSLAEMQTQSNPMGSDIWQKMGPK